MPVSRSKIFISYSHQDKAWLDEFERMIQPLAQNGKLVTWNDRKIVTGQEWYKEIVTAISCARVVVLAVSDHFLASAFIHEVELPLMLEAAESDGVAVCWCLLSHCLYEESPIVRFQAAHDIRIPFDSLSPSKRKSELKQIVKKVDELYRSYASKEAVRPENPLSFDDSDVPDSKGGGLLAIELTMSKRFRTCSDAERKRVLQAIARLLDIEDHEIRIRYKGHGE